MASVMECSGRAVETTAAALRAVHQGLYRMMLQRPFFDEREQFVIYMTKIMTKIGFPDDRITRPAYYMP